MNTVLMSTPYGFRVTNDDNALSSVLVSLAKRNAFMPNITKVLYNDPVTKVYFADGTWVLVKTSEHDTFDKERGLIYAMVKKMMGEIDPKTGEVKSNGYMCELKRFVDNAYDQKAAKVEKEAQKVEAPKTESKPKKEKPSLRKCVTKLDTAIDKLAALIENTLKRD